MSLPWQLRLSTIFDALLPAEVQRREPYWREDDLGVHDNDGNNVLRFRNYSSDGHDYRQETVMSAGTSVGTVMKGNDRVGDVASHITYADVIVKVAQAVNFKVPQDKLLWNSTPFNPELNPTFVMPPGLAAVQDAFGVAEGLTGLSALEDFQNTMNLINDQIGDLGITGDADFTSPFAAYATLTPQKLMLMNFGMIMFLQMLLKGIPLFMAGPVPVTLNPVGATIAALARIRTATAYTASVEGKVIGNELKQTLLASVPGIGAAFS